jgi:hypothetical protein
MRVRESARRTSVTLIAVAALISVVSGVSALAGGSDSASNEFTDLEPLPADVRSDGIAIEAEIAKRVTEWKAEFVTEGMSEEALTDGILTLWNAMSEFSRGDPERRWADIPAADGWLAFKELGARLEVLCQELPADHDLRRDFC